MANAVKDGIRIAAWVLAAALLLAGLIGLCTPVDQLAPGDASSLWSRLARFTARHGLPLMQLGLGVVALRVFMVPLLLPLMIPAAAAEELPLPCVRLNQLGYRPGDVKAACVVDAQGAFAVLTYPAEEVVYEGQLSSPIQDPVSGDRIARAVFSELTRPGTYILRTAGGSSHPFRITEGAYQEALAASLGFFTLQRCGQAFTPQEAGRHAHGACHTHGAAIYGTGIPKAVSGGWHDAGDYGRYVVPAGKAVLDLLLARRDYPEAFGGALLEEVRYELDWLLQMQEEETGGVYHKLTSMSFVPLNVMPDECVVPMYLSPVSATATGDFAGMCAYASLFFRESDPGYAATLLAAAEKAYGWLAANPNAPGFTNPPGITTGEYGDAEDSDERALAAAALYLATGEARYQEDLRPLLGKNTGIGWADMGLYSALLYLQAPPEQRDEGMYARAEKALADKAARLARIAQEDGYGVALGSADYIWGSNMNVASHGMVFLLAYPYTKDDSLLQMAQNQLHYLLGKNPNGISYVTGFGAYAAQKPHHRPSVAAGAAMPGMLVGGPNAGLEDGVEHARLSKLPPPKRYLDHWDAYALNEVAIYWNSPLVYLLAAFQ
ncbi:MAG: glycoside hydrolase family 9 protein [Candidatus Limiplasma sp.]|nr:glycoside hydrolase family 9 protein [Candidatus Limiplasma sp.]